MENKILTHAIPVPTETKTKENLVDMQVDNYKTKPHPYSETTWTKSK